MDQLVVMDKFLSCDWGTSSFRLRLVQADSRKIMTEVTGDQGIAVVYKSWEQQGKNPLSRIAFYTAIIKDQLRILEQKTAVPLNNIPIVLSGMASSTIGLIDLPYKNLPFNTDGLDLEVKLIAASDGFNPMIIISGAKTDNDVMRGEETKIVGCASSLADSQQEQLLILPGTHPKHIILKDQKITNFKSFMTGEFFDLLSTQSILSTSVEKGGDFDDPSNQKSFIEGVKTSQITELLHSGFFVRTNQVLKNMPKHQNFYYLSGLLIGTELKDVNPGIPVHLLGGSAHRSFYSIACETIGLPVISQLDADDALIKGQQIIFSRYY